MSTHHDVLRESLLTVSFDDEPGRREPATLPQVLAWLSDDRSISFAALQRHQHHPWHTFLVQLGAIALDHAELATPPTRADAWEQLLLALTDGAREPWCLVVDALDKPALLQPPVPEGRVDVLKNEILTADALDILLTARNFDVKAQKAEGAGPEHWLFALVAKQTFEGYSGKDNHGVLRMNGGAGSRPCVALAPSPRWADRFRRDIAVWLDRRPALIESYGYDPTGPALLWTVPWDGQHSLSPRSLHPFFIEVCRRIRLQRDGQALRARAGTSSSQRVDKTGVNGDTGDIWTPIQAKKDGRAALTLASTGFTYRKLHELLFGDWEQPAARALRPEDGDTPVLIAMALVRGQGKTEGYHERRIPIPGKARRFFASTTDDQRLAVRSKAQVERASEADRIVLKPALCTLLQGTGDLDFRDDRARPWLARLNERIDDHFFTELFDAAPLDADEARVRWDRLLVTLLQQTFEEALGEIPMPTAHHYRTRAAAEARLRAALRKTFPEVTHKPPVEEHAHV